LKLFDVEDVSGGQEEPMDIEETFRSFKIEVRELSGELKGLAKAPVESVSKLLNEQCQLTRIGEVPTSELFPLELKAVVR
jgi:hypothetical protein